MNPKTRKVKTKLNLIKVLSPKRLTLQELLKYSGHEDLKTLEKDLGELYMVGSFPYTPADYIEIDFDGNTVGIKLPTGIDSSINLNIFELIELRDMIERALKEESNESRKKNLISIRDKIKNLIPYSNYEPLSEMKEKIQNSINHKLKIRFDYLSRKDGKIKERSVNPLYLLEENTGYLVAFCNSSQDLRIFRFESISNLTVTDEHFEDQNKIVKLNQLKELIQKTNPEEKTVEKSEILFLPEIEFNLSLRMNFMVTEKNIQLNGKIFFKAETEVIDRSWFKDTMLSFGNSVVVLSPLYLRDEILQHVNNFKRSVH